ncbi:hypothetical protein L7F22_057549 [Adiantum nelumboides]|nr:hypothetical protein [Adiantum nelumboides]
MQKACATDVPPDPSTTKSFPSNASTVPPSSPSALLRAQGNALYKQILEGGFCLTIKRSRLARALQLYKEALNASVTVDDKASCYKNLGMLHLLFCKVELNQQVLQAGDCHDGAELLDKTESFSVCKFYLFKAVDFLSHAQEHGAKAKSQPWLDHLQTCLSSIVEWASEQSSLLSVSYSPLLQYVCEAFEKADFIPNISRLVAVRTYANALFKEALTKKFSDESMDYKGCQSLLHLCLVPLRKATLICSDAEEQGKTLLHEVQELEGSVNVHLCICEAMQAIALGDKYLSEALMDSEELDMEKVKDSLDCYRQASIATRELDMESEAVAVSRIGKLYSDVLKLPEEAHKYHFQALRLALTVMSPSIERAEWYQYCLDKVKAHQEVVVAKENNKNDEEREPAMQRLEKKLAALQEEANKGAEALLKYVYAQHPHPDINKNVVPCFGSADNTKASIKKAILHYHPDSNVRYGDDWKVLCEEICKHLNEKYYCFKLG